MRVVSTFLVVYISISIADLFPNLNKKNISQPGRAGDTLSFVRAKIIFVHGYSDHINRYDEFFTYLASRGLAVHGFDQRGWGRSVTRPSQRGLTGPTRQVVADLAAVIRSHLPPAPLPSPPPSPLWPSSPAAAVASTGSSMITTGSTIGDAEAADTNVGTGTDTDAYTNPHASPSANAGASPPLQAGRPPVFVLGHSMGGGEALALMADPAYAALVSRVRGWLLESPFVAFSSEAQPSWLKVAVGRLVARVLPRYQLVSRIPPENLSRDPAVVRSLAADPLNHGTGTLEGLAGMLDRTAALGAGKIRPRAPAVRSLWVGHGSLDRGTSYAGSKHYFDEFTREVPDRQFKTYEGWFHQLHADGPCSKEFFEDVTEWVLERCGPGETGGGAEGLQKHKPEMAKL